MPKIRTTVLEVAIKDDLATGNIGFPEDHQAAVALLLEKAGIKADVYLADCGVHTPTLGGPLAGPDPISTEEAPDA